MLLKRWSLLKAIMADQRLNPSALRVMYFMLDRENSKTKALFPSHSRLSRDTGLSERSVRRGVDCLIENNYLQKMKKGGPGRSTTYSINYEHRTELSKTQDRNVQNIRSEMTDQSTNKSTNESSESKKNKISIKNIIQGITKHTNPEYKAVVNGSKLPFNSNEAIADRILKKTGDPLKAEAFLKLKKSSNWDDKVRADDFAEQLGCLKLQ